MGAASTGGEDENARLMESRRAIIEREVLWRDRDHSQRWILQSKLPVLDPVSHAVTGLVTVSRDITQSRLLEREVLEVTEREQRRIGSDLHDGLGQELTGLGLMIRALQSELENENSPHLAQVRRIGEVLKDAFASARSVARALAPTNIERGGLHNALQELSRHCTELFGVACEFSGPPGAGDSLSDSASSHVYRIAQEATGNAAKHARAHRISVTLLAAGADLELSIVDDGIGFDPATSGAGGAGMGLKTMAYRARMLGGALITTREPQGGTRVRCRFPVLPNQRKG
jgi:signal transduction histidine kinase